MNKEETIEAINKLPLFRKRDIATKNWIPESQFHPDPTWHVSPKHDAITEETKVVPLTFVSKRYKLVQMKELFLPIVEKMGEIEGKLKYHDGFAIMDLFPVEDEYAIEDGTRIGICAYNSVDKTSALNIKFSVKSDNRVFIMPKKAAAFRKIHVGRIKEQTKDYIDFLQKIKEVWVGVHTRMTTKVVDESDYEEALKMMGENPKDKHWVRKKWILYNHNNYSPDGIQKGPSVWTLVKEVYDQIDRTKFKSDIHKRKHLDTLANTVFDYDFILKLG